MILFTQLVMLIAAFFGANLSNTQMDLESQYIDPDIISLYCSGYDSDADDFHNNFQVDSYAWQACLLRDANGERVDQNDAYLLDKDEAKTLVEEVWADYTPWMRDQFARKLIFSEAEVKKDQRFYKLLLAEDWSPRVPLINRGNKKIAEHCTDSDFGCVLPPDLDVHRGKRLGRSVWWRTTTGPDSHPSWSAKLKYASPARIVLHKQNLFQVLDRLAWQINWWRSFQWDDTEATTEPRVGNFWGDSIAYRCLVLDLYNNYIEDPTKIIPQWRESYAELHRLCKITAPGYAQPVTDRDD